MKNQFPDRAIIRISDRAALEMFVDYCVSVGLCWTVNCPMVNALRFVGDYLERHVSDTCIHIEPGYESDIVFGYCYAAYYNSVLYLNKDDPRWNFCSVEEFIAWTGGASTEEDPGIEIDLDAIL